MIRSRATALTVTVLAALALAGCGSSSTSGSATPSDTPSSAAPAPDLLYAAGGEIHDGDTTVDVQGVDQIEQVMRTSDGWAVAAETSGDDVSDLTLVAADGGTSDVVSIRNTFDVNSDGTMVVPADVDGILKLYSTADGSVVKEWHPNTDGQENVSEAEDARFNGNAVIVRAHDSSGFPIVVRWEPNRGANTVLAESWESLTASEDGNVIAGDSGKKDCLTVGTSEYGNEWRSCDWTAPGGGGAQISPDGTKVLAVPAAASDDSVDQLGVLSVKDGAAVADQVTVPDDSTAATWAGDDRLFVVSETSEGATISLCTLDGDCETVAESDQSVVLGG